MAACPGGFRNDRPIAMLRPKGRRMAVLFIHTDHLGTPKLLTNDKGQVRWEASARPFGLTEAKGKGVELPLRFPGQYEDRESGLHYNYFRHYLPDSGRYSRTDPLGLAGEMHLYVYGRGNPVSLMDLKGLDVFSCVEFARSGRQGFMDCYFDKAIWKPAQERLDAYAEEADCSMRCSADCGISFLQGEAVGKAVEFGARKFAERFATGLVKKFLTRGIPVVGQIETAYSGVTAVKCTVDCWRL